MVNIDTTAKICDRTRGVMSDIMQYLLAYQ